MIILKAEWSGRVRIQTIPIWRRLVSFVRYSNNNVEALDAFILVEVVDNRDSLP